jgi:hypothetical protein
MFFRTTLKALTIWAVILLLAVLNGALRETILIPKFGPTMSLIFSALILSILIFVVAYFSLPWFGLRCSAELVTVGLAWLALTIVFEFSFGLWLGKSWQVMFEAYTFKDGNLWPVVLVVTTLAPYLSAKLRDWKSHQPEQQSAVSESDRPVREPNQSSER